MIGRIFATATAGVMMATAGWAAPAERDPGAAVPSARLHAPYVATGQVQPDGITVLHAFDAVRTGRFQTKPVSHIKGEVIDWISPEQALSWIVDVPATGDYGATALVRVKSDALLTLTLTDERGGRVAAPYRPDPQGGQSASPLDGTLRLTRGRHRLTLSVTPTPRDAAFTLSVLSVELAQPAVRERLHREALAMRADTRWMRDIPFALGVHWTARTMPRSGPQKTYEEAVNAFDTERFADQVASTGAGALYFVTAHSDQYLPFPNAALDRILPGRTTKRDLVADMIRSLDKRGIKLILYYHLGPWEDQPWGWADGLWNPNPARTFANWRAIVSEAGARYGRKLAAWWFDDGLYNYYYRSPDWKSLTAAAKVGNPDRAVGYNSWDGTRATEFQDFYTGEAVAKYEANGALNRDGSMNGLLTKGGDGRMTAGGFAGLQASANYTVDGDWVHATRDSPVPAPTLTTEQLAEMMGSLKAHGGLTIINAGIYQDGTIAQSSLDRIRDAARRAGLIKR